MRGGAGGDTPPWAVVMVIAVTGVYYVPINYDKSERFGIIQLNYRTGEGQDWCKHPDSTPLHTPQCHDDVRAGLSG